jgi:hypothetical protein
MDYEDKIEMTTGRLTPGMIKKLEDLQKKSKNLSVKDKDEESVLLRRMKKIEKERSGLNQSDWEK